MRLKIIAGVTLALLTSMAFSAAAQDYPNRPVKFVVPFAAGGGNDIVARIVGEKVSELWKTPVVIENRAGAGGNSGAEFVNAATPDGYTLFFSTQGPLAVNRSLYKQIRYNPDAFTPISLVAISANVLAASSKTSWTSLKELIDYARANPDRVTYASSGAGTTAHLAAEMLNSMAQIKMIHVPYRGTGPAVTDLVSAQVDVMFAEISAVGQFVESGDVKALGIGSETPERSMPGVPPISRELPGFAAATWYGVVGPRGLPDTIIREVSSRINQALQDPGLKAKLEKISVTPLGGSPADLTKYMGEEKDRWAKVIRDANIKID
ncbi:MAG: extra-cytoplasmic solute receptor BugT [Hyphomicrobiales bacterium]|nr:extra-cytoplasmic solute receptor BugT [Hyphomicrobiales bacterium]